MTLCFCGKFSTQKKERGIILTVENYWYEDYFPEILKTRPAAAQFVESNSTPANK